MNMSPITASRPGADERPGTPRLSAAQRYFQLGRWDDALAVLEPAVGMAGPDYHQAQLHGLWALIAGHRDDQVTLARQLAAVAAEPSGSADQRCLWNYLFLGGALAAERAGRPAEGAAVLARCLEPGHETEDRYLLLPDLVRLALAAGDPGLAAAAARAAEADADADALPVKAAAAGRCGGLVAGDAERLLAAAAYYESSGRPLDRGNALEDAAVLLAGAGDPAGARAALRDAVQVYEGLGAVWDITRADARTRPLGVRRRRAGTRRPSSGWAALTPTEVRIAALVAEGLSNPDIGARLFVSWHTVRFHVSSIMAKLGVHSRLEIARLAAAHLRDSNDDATGARSPALPRLHATPLTSVGWPASRRYQTTGGYRCRRRPAMVKGWRLSSGRGASRMPGHGPDE
jgi:DNA-binding CsgD family transcriptional regulator